MGRFRPSEFSPTSPQTVKRWKAAVPLFTHVQLASTEITLQVPCVPKTVGSKALLHHHGSFLGVETGLGIQQVPGLALCRCDQGPLQLDGKSHFLRSGVAYQPVQDMWTGNRYFWLIKSYEPLPPFIQGHTWQLNRGWIFFQRFHMLVLSLNS